MVGIMAGTNNCTIYCKFLLKGNPFSWPISAQGIEWCELLPFQDQAYWSDPNGFRHQSWHMILVSPCCMEKCIQTVRRTPGFAMGEDTNQQIELELSKSFSTILTMELKGKHKYQ